MASSYLTLPSPRRRAISIALTILVHVALMWALINLGPAREFVPLAQRGSLSTYDVAPEAKTATKPCAGCARPGSATSRATAC